MNILRVTAGVMATVSSWGKNDVEQLRVAKTCPNRIVLPSNSTVRGPRLWRQSSLTVFYPFYSRTETLYGDPKYTPWNKNGHI